MTNLYGPWEFTQGDEQNPLNGIVKDARGHLISLRSIMNDDDRAVSLAIAAAPEMLGALKQAIYLFAPHHTVDGTETGKVIPTAGGMAIQAMRNVLAKAEEKQDRENDTSDFWDRFDILEGQALATNDGQAFNKAGFKFFHNGGGCTAWRKEFSDGRYILVTNEDGGNHSPVSHDDSYLVGFYKSFDDTDPESCHGIRLAKSAVIEASRWNEV